jgi:hypothetical protein
VESSQALKSISTMDLSSFDVIVNLCEYRIPNEETIPSGTVVLKRPIADPMGQGERADQQVLEQVEKIVEFLGEHFRRARDWNPFDVSAEAAPQTRKWPPPLAWPRKAAARTAAI